MGCPFVELVKGCNTRVPASSRAVTSLKPGSCVSSHMMRNPVSVTLHTQTLPPAVTGPRPGPCVPPRYPTTGLSLVQLARSLGPSDSAMRFSSPGVPPSSGPVLRAEIAVLLVKDAIEPVPPAGIRSGFYSPYFIVPKKIGGLQPILDLRVLNRVLHKLPFKMLTQKRIFGCVHPLDWFAAIDLKDAYIHVSILPRHRPYLRFAIEG